MNNLVYVVSVGEEGFTNKNHVKNFVKYLFSCSKAHIENENTKFNFYVKRDLKDNNLNRIGFIKNPVEQCNDFLNNFGKELFDENKLKNDIYYALFFVVTKDKLITNFFEYQDNELNITYPENVMDAMCEKYCDNDEREFEESINQILRFVYDNKIEIKPFKETTLEERKEIEMLVHGRLIKENNEKVLIEISHHDQDDHDIYHIHRLKIK